LAEWLLLAGMQRYSRLSEERACAQLRYDKMNMPKPTNSSKAASENRCNQKRHARQTPNTPGTSALATSDAVVAKTKYNVSAITANMTMKPYGIKFQKRQRSKAEPRRPVSGLANSIIVV
jgi:hypothetical protein